MVSAKNAPIIRDPIKRRKGAKPAHVEIENFSKRMVSVRNVIHTLEHKEMESSVDKTNATPGKSFWSQVNAKYATNTKLSRKTESNA